MNDESHVGTILAEVLLLTAVVILVDERWIRAALAFVPALLLAQRALKPLPAAVSSDERSPDPRAQEHTKELLTHFRDFYAACHQVVRGEITPSQAVNRTSHLEKDLNQLLNRIQGG